MSGTRMIPPLSCSSSESAPPPRPRAPRPLERERQRERARRAGRRQWSAPATVLLTILLAGLAGDLCAAYPSGAPEQACKELKPGHGVEAQAGPAPFELVQDRREAGPGDQIKVTLSSPSKATFKGLMVQALNESGEPSGKFLAGTGLKLIDSCSAVTHSDKEPKKTATLVWEPAADLKSKQSFTFRATVVQKFDEYYLNIRSTVQSAKRR